MKFPHEWRLRKNIVVFVKKKYFFQRTIKPMVQGQKVKKYREYVEYGECWEYREYGEYIEYEKYG